MFTPSGSSEHHWASRNLTHTAQAVHSPIDFLIRGRHTEDVGNELWSNKKLHGLTQSDINTHSGATAGSISWTKISFMMTQGDLEKCGTIPGELAHAQTHSL